MADWEIEKNAFRLFAGRKEGKGRGGEGGIVWGNLKLEGKTNCPQEDEMREGGQQAYTGREKVGITESVESVLQSSGKILPSRWKVGCTTRMGKRGDGNVTLLKNILRTLSTKVSRRHRGGQHREFTKSRAIIRKFEIKFYKTKIHSMDETGKKTTRVGRRWGKAGRGSTSRRRGQKGIQCLIKIITNLPTWVEKSSWLARVQLEERTCEERRDLHASAFY